MIKQGKNTQTKTPSYIIKNEQKELNFNKQNAVLINR